MYRRGQRYIDGVRLFPGIHTPKWAFRVYNNMSGSVLREGAHKGPGRTPHPTTARLPPSKRTFYSRFPAIIPDLFSLDARTSETRCPANPAHLRLKYTAILPQPRGGRPIGVLTRQEGRLKRTGPGLVLRVSGSCCCLGLKLRLEPLVHFQTGSSLRQAPPTSNAPVGHSYSGGGTVFANMGGARLNNDL